MGPSASDEDEELEECPNGVLGESGAAKLVLDTGSNPPARARITFLGASACNTDQINADFVIDFVVKIWKYLSVHGV